MAKYSAEQIAAMLQAGDASTYHETGADAQELTRQFKHRTKNFNELLGKMKSAWTGESSDAAATSLSALQEAFTVSSDNLHRVSQQLDTQGQSFTKVKHEVGTGPGPKQIGRASCRERVEISGVAVTGEEKKMDGKE